MKIKHNKTRNTGLLYELLVKQIASDTLSGTDSPAISILKKYFSGNSVLVKEFKLYEFILKNKNVSESKAETILSTVVEFSKKLNQNSLKKQKYELIKEIKENYDLNEFFSIKVNTYKPLAALYCLIEGYSNQDSLTPEVVINHKTTLLEHLTGLDQSTPEKNDSLIEEFSKYEKDLRLLTYRLLLEKFNKKYTNLLPEQKEVLREFITSVSSTNKLKNSVNNRLIGIKEEIVQYSNKIKDPVISIKVNEIHKGITLLENKDRVSEENLTLLMQYYELISELKNL
jgi:hypothetical protein